MTIISGISAQGLAWSRQPRSGQPGVCLHSSVTGAGACQGELEGGRNWLQHKIEASDQSKILNNASSRIGFDIIHFIEYQ